MSTSTSRRETTSSTDAATRIKTSISTSTSTSTTRPSLATTSTRRHSLFGTEDRIVIDLGTRVLKIGFSGESRPRLVIRSLHLARLNDYDRHKTGDGKEAEDKDDSLWDMDFGKCRNDREREERENLLKARLIHLFRELFAK